MFTIALDDKLYLAPLPEKLDVWYWPFPMFQGHEERRDADYERAEST